MNVLQTEWWSMALPPEWWAEAEEDSILVGDRDGVGCIEFSSLHKESGAFDPATLREMANEGAEQELEWQACQLGEFKGLYSSFSEDGAAIREWWVANEALALFITYSCEMENRGMDDAAVDELLDTLLVAEEDHAQ